MKMTKDQIYFSSSKIQSLDIPSEEEWWSIKINYYGENIKLYVITDVLKSEIKNLKHLIGFKTVFNLKFINNILLDIYL